MSAHVFIFVNGILANPGAHDDWTDRAVSWMHRNTVHQAEKFEYRALVLTRRFTQGKNADALRKLINAYCSDGRLIHLIGHSNGCDIITRAIQDSFCRVASASLISGACDASFEKNGLNVALRSGRLAGVVVYVAGRDRAMKLANITRRLVSWMGLGYGTLGLSGPSDVAPGFEGKVETTVEPEFGHSTWFDGSKFDATMRRILPVAQVLHKQRRRAA